MADDVTEEASHKRSQTFSRLQIGVAGIAIVLGMVALADMLNTQASNVAPVPQGLEAPTVAVPETSEQPGEPMVDLGVAPDLPAETPGPTPSHGAVVPDLPTAPASPTPSPSPRRRPQRN